ncbi:hypothetical protein G4G28_04370 [Massilia sp. Dwa41.01b]|uniref:hypothetical protein n=2 Tax=unclassified Massilia TaxID=2609279 RepID=UPI001601C35E|nr:hypothetical protein [Massilia sp. Dwa41.01b]QNA87211.1 hypothetical protein G4G28_04370 [Massilia sp. Dwa41.01b]
MIPFESYNLLYRAGAQRETIRRSIALQTAARRMPARRSLAATLSRTGLNRLVSHHARRAHADFVRPHTLKHINIGALLVHMLELRRKVFARSQLNH